MNKKQVTEHCLKRIEECYKDDISGLVVSIVNFTWEEAIKEKECKDKKEITTEEAFKILDENQF